MKVNYDVVGMALDGKLVVVLRTDYAAGEAERVPVTCIEHIAVPTHLTNLRSEQTAYIALVAPGGRWIARQVQTVTQNGLVIPDQQGPAWVGQIRYVPEDMTLVESITAIIEQHPDGFGDLVEAPTCGTELVFSA